MLDDVLKKWGASEVTAMTVYSDIFRIGEGYIQRTGDDHNGVSNPLVYMKNANREKGAYRILLEDTFEETLKEAQEADFAIVNGLTYFGRKNLSAAAHKMYAMIFDLDGVTDSTLNNFLSGAILAGAYPVPNYVALSGHGIHLYYLMEEPVPLYPNLKIQLKELKYTLIQKMWNPYTSTDDPQLQGINQGFRPIGGKTKLPEIRVRAFRLNTHPFTLGQLCSYVSATIQIDEGKLYKESKLTLEQAKVKYPLWYQKRIVEGDTSKGHWTCKRDLYDWWIRQIKAGAAFHHRYFNIMCLAIYGMKSGIPEEEVTRDAYDLIPFMNNIAPGEPFTESDVQSALEAYDERYYTFPRDDISKLSGIPIEANKRNGRQQKIHLERARAVQEIDYPDGEWRNQNGRPSKRDQVEQWQYDHPDGRKCDAIRDLRIDRKTVSKYWRS